jgi:hypothetical protein
MPSIAYNFVEGVSRCLKLSTVHDAATTQNLFQVRFVTICPLPAARVAILRYERKAVSPEKSGLRRQSGSLTIRQAVTGYTPRELDLVIDRGEIDARGNIVDTTIQRNPHWFEKDLIDLHAVLDIPRGINHAHPRFAKLPDIESFAKSRREQRLIELIW